MKLLINWGGLPDGTDLLILGNDDWDGILHPLQE